MMAKKKILYIEDELSLATMVKDTLEIGGYEVFTRRRWIRNN